MRRSFLKYSLFCFIILVSFTGCQTDSVFTGNEIHETFTVNLAYGNQPGEPIDQLAHKWKELAEAESNGRLQFNLYPSSQLGSEADVVEQALFGSNVIILTGYDFLMNSVPDIGVLSAPYLVDDIDELFYLTETDWFEGLLGQLQKMGLDIVTTNTFLGNAI